MVDAGAAQDVVRFFVDESPLSRDESRGDGARLPSDRSGDAIRQRVPRRVDAGGYLQREGRRDRRLEPRRRAEDRADGADLPVERITREIISAGPGPLRR